MRRENFSIFIPRPAAASLSLPSRGAEELLCCEYRYWFNFLSIFSRENERENFCLFLLISSLSRKYEFRKESAMIDFAWNWKTRTVTVTVTERDNFVLYSHRSGENFVLYSHRSDFFFFGYGVGPKIRKKKKKKRLDMRLAVHCTRTVF